MASETTTVIFDRFTTVEESVRVPIYASEPVAAARLIEALGSDSFTLRRKGQRYGGKRAMVAGAKSATERDNVGGIELRASKPVSAQEIAQRIRKSAGVIVKPAAPRKPRKSKSAAQPSAPANASNGAAVP